MASLSATFSEGILPNPGIFRNNTDYYSGFSWVDGDKIRFPSLVPEKIGGWQREIVSGSLLGVPRRVLPWSALDSQRYICTATNLFLYIASGGVYYNITPFRKTSVLANVITTVGGSSTVRITDNAHGVRVGDYIKVTASVTYNGVTLLGDYVIVSVVDINNYTITASTNASGSGTGGGAITIKYYLEAGLADSGSVGYGWGVGPYGAEAYGTARTSGILTDCRLWCLQNWGEDILALVSGGKLYFWDTSVGVTTEAQEVTAAPDRSNFMLVASKFRQCVLFGTENVSAVFDPMLIRWSDIEDYTTWVPSATNSAGEFRLTEGNRIVGAIETKGGEFLVFTDTACYRMRPVDTDAVYDIELVGKSCGLLAPFAVAEVDGIVYWMSQSTMKMYTGQVRTLPSSLEDYIFDQRSEGRYNHNQKAKFYVGNNGDFNEIWFFYATEDSTEINRYYIYNYGNDTWCDGTMNRTCWVDKGISDKPIAYNSSGTLYIHEQGVNDDASALHSYVRLGSIDVSQGSEIAFIDRFLPDGNFIGTMTLTLYAKKFPQSTEEIQKEYSFVTPTEHVGVRIRGRLLSCKLTSNEYNGDFKLGKLKFAVKADGAR
jgi:hypothetical protein